MVSPALTVPAHVETASTEPPELLLEPPQPELPEPVLEPPDPELPDPAPPDPEPLDPELPDPELLDPEPPELLEPAWESTPESLLGLLASLSVPLAVVDVPHADARSGTTARATKRNPIVR